MVDRQNLYGTKFLFWYQWYSGPFYRLNTVQFDHTIVLTSLIKLIKAISYKSCSFSFSHLSLGQRHNNRQPCPHYGIWSTGHMTKQRMTTKSWTWSISQNALYVSIDYDQISLYRQFYLYFNDNRAQIAKKRPSMSIQMIFGFNRLFDHENSHPLFCDWMLWTYCIVDMGGFL